MRVAYTLGVLRELRRASVDSSLGSVFTSSAGMIAALGLVASDFDAYAEKLLPKLSGRRFINSRRVLKVVDVDYLVDGVVMPLLDIDRLTRASTPGVIVSALDEISGTVGHFRVTPDNVRTLLRATMAIPVLYGRSVEYEGRFYVDGGVGDPVPLAAALRGGQSDVVAVVLTKNLDDVAQGVRGKERLAVSIDPRIKPLVRHLLLSRNLLGAQAKEWIRDGKFGGTPIATVMPSDPSAVTSRTCTDIDMLSRFRELGARDGQVFGSRLIKLLR
jgi:predicted patatin/cPLA2 family phospholipase